MKNIKTLNSLKNKSKGNGRMPSLKKVSELLNELNIVNTLSEWSEMKQTKSGNRYYTGGGTKLYTGYKLVVPEINLHIESTDTYYSYNTWQYARELCELIETTIGKELSELIEK